ncbi:MAG: hypothetical protein JOS17DRAFT_764430 [Linnemannia elongata]|nr:MAG: hypothetical protein JOS17DRAFT_764430 [Linnemannia elongata]
MWLCHKSAGVSIMALVQAILCWSCCLVNSFDHMYFKGLLRSLLFLLSCLFSLGDVTF